MNADKLLFTSVAALVVFWFAGGLYGMAVVAVQLALGLDPALGELLTYIGVPMGTGVAALLAERGAKYVADKQAEVKITISKAQMESTSNRAE